MHPFSIRLSERSFHSAVLLHTGSFRAYIHKCESSLFRLLYSNFLFSSERMAYGSPGRKSFAGFKILRRLASFLRAGLKQRSDAFVRYSKGWTLHLMVLARIRYGMYFLPHLEKKQSVRAFRGGKYGLQRVHQCRMNSSGCHQHGLERMLHTYGYSTGS